MLEYVSKLKKKEIKYEKINTGRIENMKTKKLLNIIFVLLITIGSLTPFVINKIKNENLLITEKENNPYDGRTEIQKEKYDEFLKEQEIINKSYEEAKENVKNKIQKLDKEKTVEESFQAVGNIIQDVGKTMNYNDYSKINWNNFWNVANEYIDNNDQFTPQEYDDGELQQSYEACQEILDSINENSNDLWLDVHNALITISGYSPEPSKQNWAHWLLMAKKCNYFNPTYVFKNDDNNNILGINKVYADTINGPTTVDSTVTLGVIQSTSISCSGSCAYPKYKTGVVTGSEQTVKIAKDGLYKLELRGGDGGSDLWAGGAYGGDGGTTIVYKYLEKDTILYINVGGTGYRTAEGGRTGGTDRTGNFNFSGVVYGGYNGGGKGITKVSGDGSSNQGQGGSGGGATSVALQSGTLSSVASDKIIAVAGGGGGASGIDAYGGNSYISSFGGGGGADSGTAGKLSCSHSSSTGYCSSSSNGSTGGSQTSGGSPYVTNYSAKSGAYGTGGDSNEYTGGGGGGGYYGGGGGSYNGSGQSSAGGGGSGYIPSTTTSFGGVDYTNTTTAGATSNDQTQRSGNGVSGSVKITLIVEQAFVDKPTISNSEKTYNGENQSPTITGYVSDSMNVTGTTQASDANEYAITYTPKSGYAWTDGSTDAVTLNWKINPYELANSNVQNIETQYYEGEDIIPDFVVSALSKTLVKNTDYQLTLSNNSGPGTANATIKGINNFTGTINMTFAIQSKQYNITYVLGGGINNVLNPNTYKYTDDTIVLGNPIKYGYDFIGWEPEGVIESGSREDKEFTAVWTPSSYSYEGSTFKKGEGAAETRVVASNYYSDFDYVYSFVPITNACREGVAEPEPQIIKFTLTYELDGGTISSDTNVEVDAGDYITLETPSKAGWDFVEYNSSPNGDGERYEGEIQITNNLTVYAIYSQTQYRYATAKSYSNNLLSEAPTAEAYKEITIYGYQDAETYSSITSTKPDGYYKTGSGQNAVCGTTQECTRTEDNLWDCCPKCGNDGLHDQSMGGCRHNYVCVASITVNKSCTYYYPVATWGAENWAQTVSENNSFTEVNATSGTPRKALSKTGYQIASEYDSFSSWQASPIEPTPDKKIETRVAYNYQSN